MARWLPAPKLQKRIQRTARAMGDWQERAHSVALAFAAARGADMSGWSVGVPAFRRGDPHRSRGICLLVPPGSDPCDVAASLVVGI